MLVADRSLVLRSPRIHWLRRVRHIHRCTLRDHLRANGSSHPAGTAENLTLLNLMVLTMIYFMDGFIATYRRFVSIAGSILTMKVMVVMMSVMMHGHLLCSIAGHEGDGASVGEPWINHVELTSTALSEQQGHSDN